MEILGYTSCRQLSQMLMTTLVFHGSEFILAASIHGKSNVTYRNLLFSKQDLLELMCSLLEYFLEIFLFPGLKEFWWISNLGLAMVVIGEIIRKIAILTASQAFTHTIRIHHDEQHKLVTCGIYRFLRHPGYCGCLIWAIGTQVMLCNPISTVAIAVIVWKFFADRIAYEEHFLRQFFGSQYVEYARHVPSGVPFIR